MNQKITIENDRKQDVTLRTTSTCDHLYTTSEPEVEEAKNKHGYKYEGIACYVYGCAVQGMIPLYRLWSSSNKDHFYTTSLEEQQKALATQHYVSEGIVCYVMNSLVEKGVPLFRLWNPDAHDHFYTISNGERANTIKKLGYIDEGIVCKVYELESPGTIPLHRMIRLNEAEKYGDKDEQKADEYPAIDPHIKKVFDKMNDRKPIKATSENKSRSPWSKIGKISTSIGAIVTLVIICLTFYFTFIRKSEDVKVSILSICPSVPNGFPFEVEVVFINLGNTDCLIKDVQFQAKYSSTDREYFVGTGLSDKNELPLTLKRDETTPRKLIFGDIEKDVGRGAPHDKKIECKISFLVIDRKGTPHTAETPSFYTMRTGNNASIDMQGKFPIIITLLPTDPVEYKAGVRTLYWHGIVKAK